jgi:hypothetical protein
MGVHLIQVSASVLAPVGRGGLLDPSCGWQKMRRSRKSNRPSRRGSYRFSLEQWSHCRDRGPIGWRPDRCEALVAVLAIGSSLGLCLRQTSAGSDDADRRPVASRSPFRAPVPPSAGELDCRARAFGADVLYDMLC